MIKMMILAPKRAGMTHREFRRYVTDVHGPLVKSVKAVAQDIRHYHYNFPVPGARDTAFGHSLADHLDIVTEAWFDSVQAQKDNMRRPGYMEILRPDEHRFAGEAAVMHYMQEVPVVEGERTTIRVFYFRRRRPGLSRVEFQHLWLDGMRAVVDGGSRLPAGVTAHVQNHTVSEAEHPGGDDPKYFDAIDEFFLTDLDRLRFLGAEGASLGAIRQLESELTETSGCRAFIGETVLNIP